MLWVSVNPFSLSANAHNLVHFLLILKILLSVSRLPFPLSNELQFVELLLFTTELYFVILATKECKPSGFKITSSFFESQSRVNSLPILINLAMVSVSKLKFCLSWELYFYEFSCSSMEIYVFKLVNSFRTPVGIY